MNVTLRQLEIFLAVAHTLSFSAAAKACHLSQPALSANIKRLEETIGYRLFDRNTRKVTLTAVGKELLEATTSMKGHIDRALERVQDCAAGRKGTLTLAVTPTIAASFAPPLLGEFLAAHPDIKVKIHDVFSDISIDMLRSGDADVALVPFKPAAADLLQEPLYRDPLVVVYPPDHPLEAKATVGWADLRSFPHVVPNRSSHVRQLVDMEHLRHGSALQPAYEVNHGGALLGLIAAGCGITELPESVVQYYNLRGLRVKRIKSASAYRMICLTTVRDRSLTPVAEVFRSLCLSHATQLKGRDDREPAPVKQEASSRDDQQ